MFFFSLMGYEMRREMEGNGGCELSVQCEGAKGGTEYLLPRLVYLSLPLVEIDKLCMFEEQRLISTHADDLRQRNDMESVARHLCRGIYAMIHVCRELFHLIVLFKDPRFVRLYYIFRAFSGTQAMYVLGSTYEQAYSKLGC
jgi:hypothetical protein